MVCVFVTSVFVSPHVFSLTVAAVDAKRGYVGMCNGRSAQQESGARTACLRRGPKIIYSYYTRCALIRDRQPTAWDPSLAGQTHSRRRGSGNTHIPYLCKLA